jgi:uncharacterized protein YjbI with pentapeptide repeats
MTAALRHVTSRAQICINCIHNYKNRRHERYAVYQNRSRGSNCPVSHFQARLKNKEGKLSVLRLSVLRQSELRQSVLRQSELRQSVLRQSVLRQSVLRQSVLRQSVLRQSVLRQSVLRQSY